MRHWAGLRGYLLLTVASLCVAAANNARLYAQVYTGAILGTVRDQSGAVVPGAKVTLTNEGTGLRLTTTTDSDGGYIFTPIKIGTYAVRTEFRGFQRVNHTHVRVNVQQQVVVDFVLLPGSVTQTVEVRSAPPQLQTQNASVGQVVGARSINDLPLNGRNYTFLAQLAPGVTPDQEDTRGLGLSGSFAANGERPAQNDYLLDGIDDNSDLVDFLNGTAYVARPPVDAIQEFKVLTSDYSAELGRSAGAVLNVAMKSGTNQLHGDAWEFLRNDTFDAANFFENAASEAKGEFRQNQFGVTLGGPIVIPGVYHGKNKTFFFVDYEGTRIRQASPQLSTVPTALERSSGYTDLSELLTQGGTQIDALGRTFPLGTVMDPASTRSVFCGVPDVVSGIAVPCASGQAQSTFVDYVRDPFPGNILPATRLDPNAIKLLNLFPAPNLPGLFNNYASDRILQNDVNQFDVRIDHNFSGKDQMFGRVSYSDEPEFIPGPFTGIADGGSYSNGDQTGVAVNTALSETHIFSPTTINEAEVGFSRIGTSRLQPFAHDLANIPGQFGIQDVPQVPTNGGLPQIVLQGLSTLGSNPYLPVVEYGSTFQFSDNGTKIQGKHTLKAGVEFQHLKFSVLAPPYPRGGWGFDGVFTQVPEQSGGNNGLAQLLLTPIPTIVPNGFNYVGGADAFNASNIANTDQLRNYYGLYLQDDWKTTSKLTLNLGLRWEYFGQIVEAFGAQSNFLPEGPEGAPAQFLLTKERCNTPLSPDFFAAAKKDNISLSCSGQPGLGFSQLSNFSPRVGFAYQITPKLVARGGYGIFYGGFENSVVETYVDFPFQFTLSQSALTAAQPITFSNGSLATLETGLGGVVPLTSAAAEPEGISGTGEDYHLKTPYTQGYNFTFQYQLTPNQTVSAGYVGNTVRHLGSYINPNSPSELLPPSVNALSYSPYPDFSPFFTYTSMAGDSYYNSLQLNYERRFSQGLDVLANFTWSKCRTDASDVLNETAIFYRAPLLPGFGVQGDYGLCDFDIPHVLHLSGLYELPFGNGRRFLRNSRGVVNQIVGGWRTNWILTLEDGQPFTVPCVISTAAGMGCDALLVPGQSITSGPHDVNQWINPAAFTSPPVVATVGQSNYAPLGGAPTQALGPGFHRLDFSLFKEFQTSERTHLELRAEFFNLTNTPNFSPPGFSGNGVVASPGSLDYTSASTFGKINSLRDFQNDPREIQFALKFYW